MKIHIIITFLTLTLTFSEDIQIDPVPVDVGTQEQILPQKNPNAEARAFAEKPRPSNPDVKQFEDNFDQLQDNIIENEQRIQEQTQQQKINTKLKPWLSQQFQALHDLTDLITHQVFAFKLKDEYEFRWNPSKKGNFRIVFEVFTEKEGRVNYPAKPDEDDHIIVSSKPETASVFTEMGRVYLKRVFFMNFYTDYQTIKVKNSYDQEMLIQVSLQMTNFVPQSGVDDDEFKLSAQKIRGVLTELEDTEVQRQKMYKTEWSFRDREEQHQSEMLILTGVQLFVILGTAIVQMYCIKSLLDNRLIV